MEKNKKRLDFFIKVMTILFVMFLCLYSISTNGYLRKINQNKTLYTEEMIKKFEQDVNEGNYVDIDDYLKDETIDYSNNISKLGEKVSTMISEGAVKLIEWLNSLFSYLFN